MKKEKFSYKKYIRILLSSDNSIEADEYRNAFIPNELYKYSSFPDKMEEREKRIEAWKDERLWFSLKEALNDPFEFKNAAISDCSTEAQQYYEEACSDLAVLCLTTDKANKLMWSHYADSYRGFCIAFSQDFSGSFSPVDYFIKRPNYSNLYQKFFKMKDQIIGKSSLEYSDLKYIFALSGMECLKDKCWQYEREVRCFEKINLNTNGSGNLGDYFYASQKGMKITKFILGLNTTEDTEKQIVSISQHINLKRFDKYKKGHDEFSTDKIISVLKSFEDIIQIEKMSTDDNLNLNFNLYTYNYFKKDK